MYEIFVDKHAETIEQVKKYFFKKKSNFTGKLLENSKG